jgi:hypothetical protein
MGYGYSRWCELYRTWEGRLSPTMRQAHPGGERLFVDYAGHTVEVVDGDTGELHAAQVVAVPRACPSVSTNCSGGRRSAARRSRQQHGSLLTRCWREPDSNHRSR